MPSPHIEIRDVALRSPIMYDASKAEKLLWFDADMEVEGLGDVDVSPERAGLMTDVPARCCFRLYMRLLPRIDQDQGRVETGPW